MENKLHISWNNISVQKSMNSQDYEGGYVEGASDFQQKALEQIEREIQLGRNLKVSDDYLSALQGIQRIIKNLKA